MRVASKWGTFIPNLSTVAFGFSSYSLCTRRTDGQTDGRTKATVIAPFPTGGGIKKILFKMRLTDVLQICF